MIRLIVAFFSLILFSVNVLAGGIGTTIQTYNSPSVNSTMQTYSSPPVTQTVQPGSNTEVNVSNNSTGISQAKSEAYSSKSLANNLKNPFNLNNNYSKPLTTDTLMKPTGASYHCTVHLGNIYTSLSDCNSDCTNGTCSPIEANTKLICPSSKQFLNIFAEPSAGGDVTAYIRADTGLTGSFTSSITTPPISGVCTNGFVSCDSGTWHNCKYFEWGIKHKNTGDGITYNSLRECKTHIAQKCNSSNKCITNGTAYSSLNQCESSCPVPTCKLTSDKMIHYVQQTGMSSLGNCFAINDSVGNIFWNDFDNIMTTLGGGLIDHLSGEENIAVTKSKLDQTSMSLGYYGADTADCSAASNSSNTYNGKSPNQLKQDYQSGQISGADAEVFSQSQDPNSYYSQLANSNYMKQNPVNTYTCQIKRAVSYTNHSLTCSDIGGTGNGTKCILKQLSGNGNNGCNWTKSYSMPFYISPKFAAFPDFAMYLSWDVDDYIKHIVVDGATVSSADCSPSGVNFTSGDWDACSNSGDWMCHNGVHATKTATITKYLSPGNNTINWDWHCQGTGYFWSTLYTNIPKPYDTLNLVKTGSCSPQPGCKLKKEEVCDYNGMNCLTTVSNYSPAGTPAFPICKSISDNQTGNSWTICADGNSINYTGSPAGSPPSTSGDLETGTDVYWTVKRTYTCPASKTPPPDVTRARTVDTGTSYSGSQLNYADTLQGHSNNSINIDLSGFKKSDCIPACIVIDNNKKDTVVPNQGNPVNGTQTTKTKYLTCERTDPQSAYTCPVPSGYALKQDCSCIDGSARAISALTSADEAAHDMICSQ